MMQPRSRLMSYGRLLAAVLLAQLFVFGAGCGKKPDAAPQGKQPDGTAEQPGKPDPSGPAPAALDFVPGNGLGFIAAKVNAVWDSAPGKEAQKLLNVAAPKELEGMQEELGLKPGDVDYAGFIMIVGKQEPLLFLVAKQKLDRKLIAERMAPNAQTKTQDGKEFLVGSYVFSTIGQEIGKGGKTQPVKPPERKEQSYDPALYFVNDHAFVKGRVDHLRKYLGHKAASGMLSPALAQAGQHHLTACLHMSALIKDAGEGPPLPPDYAALLKTEVVTLTADVGTPWKVRAHATFPNDADAKAGHESAEKALSLAKGMLFQVKQMGGPGMDLFAKPLEQVDAGLKQAALKQNGKDVELALDLPLDIKVDEGTLLKATQGARQAADRSVNANNMRQIMLALHNFHDTYNKFAPQAICDKDGKPLLSWRVAILPYVEEQPLFQQFKLDEPWDGPNNKKLIEKMPKLYAMPGVKSQPGMTHYRAFRGPNTLFPAQAKVGKFGDVFGLFGIRGFGDVPDGLSNTIFLVEAGDPVPWSKPDEVLLDAKKLPKLGVLAPGKFMVGMLDGSVRSLDLQKVSEKTLRLAIDPNDGQPLGKDFND